MSPQNCVEDKNKRFILTVQFLILYWVGQKVCAVFCPKWGSKYICTYKSLLNDVCTFLFDRLSPIKQIKNPLLPERLKFFREKSLKVNFDGIRIWEIFSIKRILKRAEEMIIRWSKIRTIQRSKIRTIQRMRQNSSSFSWVRKDVCGRRCDRRSHPSCWPILGASAEQPSSNDRVARSIWRHRWFGSLGAVYNKPVPWYPRYTASSSSGEIRF